MNDSTYFLDMESLQPGDSVLRHTDSNYGPGWLCFRNPVTTLCARSLDEVEPVIEQASRYASDGGYAVGFLSYEASPGLNPLIDTYPGEGQVLAWFGLYDSVSFYKELLPIEDLVAVHLAGEDMSRAEYGLRFDAVKEALAGGESYQVNLTFRQRFSLSQSPARFFASRCGVRPPQYACYIDGGDWSVASFSPELFFKRHGPDIVMRPMKGTRSPSSLESLTNDLKSIAENIMVVDMVRNDLGSFSDVGTVRVPQLLFEEHHRGLIQMTSTVTAHSDCSVASLFKGLFPPASVTGAPKVSTCRLIKQLENSPRGVYCGAIGLIAPDWQRFSVGIRTAWIDKATSRGEFGIGSGIVWDSCCDSEYEECLSKRDFLLNPGEAWRVVESIPGHRIEDEAYVQTHLQRLGWQVRALEIPLDWEALLRTLGELGNSAPENRVKVRISVALNGRFEVSCRPSVIQGSLLKGVLASWPVGASDPNLKMKTNSRSVFEEHLEAHPEADEVLLYNSDGLLTEFCNGSLVLEIDGEWLSPDPLVGCLRGTSMAQMVADGRARYDRLKVDDLRRATKVFFVNSVVGMIPVEGL